QRERHAEGHAPGAPPAARGVERGGRAVAGGEAQRRLGLVGVETEADALGPLHDRAAGHRIEVVLVAPIALRHDAERIGHPAAARAVHEIDASVARDLDTPDLVLEGRAAVAPELRAPRGRAAPPAPPRAG